MTKEKVSIKVLKKESLQEDLRNIVEKNNEINKIEYYSL